MELLGVMKVIKPFKMSHLSIILNIDMSEKNDPHFTCEYFSN